MIKARKTFVINRSPQDVFDYVTDPANDANWQGSTESTQWISEPPHGVGSRQVQVIRFLGRRIESTMEYTHWDRPSVLGFKVVEGPLPFQGLLGLEPSGEGATELTVDFEGEVGGFFKIAEGMVGKQLEKQMDADFNALKLWMEEGSD